MKFVHIFSNYPFKSTEMWHVAAQKEIVMT